MISSVARDAPASDDRRIGEAAVGWRNESASITSAVSVEEQVHDALSRALRAHRVLAEDPERATYRISVLVDRFGVVEYATGSGPEHSRASVAYDVLVHDARGALRFAREIEARVVTESSWSDTRMNESALRQAVRDTLDRLFADAEFSALFAPVADEGRSAAIAQTQSGTKRRLSDESGRRARCTLDGERQGGGGAQASQTAGMPLHELRLDVVPALEAPALVLAFEGWNDAGDAASAAARFIADALGAAPLGGIDGEEYYDFTVQRPVVRQADDGRRVIAWPRFELRYAVIPGRTELVIGIGPEPHLRWRSWCAEMVDLAKRLRVSRVVLLGAFLADVVYTLPVHVTGFAWPPERMDELGLRASSYEGPTGIVGALGSVYPEAGFETVSFWAGLPHYIPLTPNARGTLALVQEAARYLDLPIDRTPLEREAAEFERRTAEVVAGDPQLAEYVRELKKRGFAQ